MKKLLWILPLLTLPVLAAYAEDTPPAGPPLLTDSAGHDLNDDHGSDGTGHDAGDDKGHDGADHDSGDDKGGHDGGGHDGGGHDGGGKGSDD